MSDYYTLLTALPWLADLEQSKQLPISRIALDRRLTMLADDDKEQLSIIESLYHPDWSHFDGQVDKDLIAVWKRKMSEVQSPVLLELINIHMELRTLVAALRSRASGVENPELFYGIGRWVVRIRKHWFEPGFGLEGICPELIALQRLMKKENPILLEQYINQQLWNGLCQAERKYHFSFEAVACYVLRWSIAERRIQHDGRVALEQFTVSTKRLLQQSNLDSQLLQGCSE
ncbi:MULTISPECIES: DUF2764 family protein [unclassified Neptuniibacter]|uniref:DUF2764 family protein n=1 Tax=unclassified Neptuniibacter TaxID=2630693 RepID=UPI0025CBEAA9|nr:MULTISPECIES: DUF2764 family protein [unclassified Neptuniibacter]